MTTDTITMTREVAAQLRAPFEPYEIGKLPRITCPACSKKNCNEHKKERCRDCGGWLTERHIHLDYVGHAEITDRLLQVDPEWDWEPLATDARGLPLFDEDGGLWIKLTVAGKTRLGYGDAEDKKGPAARKETIGDALRNAAMRFGVGLDLWGAKHVEPAHAARSDEPPAAIDPAEAQRRAELVVTLTAAIEAANTPAELKAAWGQVPAPAEGRLTAEQYNGLSALTKQRRGQLETGEQDNEPTPAARPAPDEATRESNPGQWDTIAAGWTKLGLAEPEQRIRIAEILGVDVPHGPWLMSVLTAKQAMQVIDWQTRASWADVDKPAEPEQPAGPLMASPKQHAAMHILWTAIGYDKDRDRRLAATGKMVGRPIATSNELTADEAGTVLRGLKAKQRSDKAKAAQTQPDPELAGVGR